MREREQKREEMEREERERAEVRRRAFRCMFWLGDDVVVGFFYGTRVQCLLWFGNIQVMFAKDRLWLACSE